MRSILLSTAFFLASYPCFALQFPSPGKDDDRVCEIKYNKNDIVGLSAEVGNEIVIKPEQGEMVDGLPSDNAPNHLKYVKTNDSTQFVLKASAGMSQKQIYLRFRSKNDPNVLLDYSFQFEAVDPLKPKDPASAASVEASNTATNPVTATDVALSAREKPVKPLYCYVVRFTYAPEASPAQIAAWKARKAKEKADAAEAALREQDQTARHVHGYFGQGDASIAPQPATPNAPAVWDDGTTTFMTFPGNMGIPAIFIPAPDGKHEDTATTDFTVEQNGVVRLHKTAPVIKLRQGDLVYCILNTNYNAIGSNPNTGTSSNRVERSVGEDR